MNTNLIKNLANDSFRARKGSAAKAISQQYKNISGPSSFGKTYTKAAKTSGLSRLGGAIGAGIVGARAIMKASKAANKSIESIHSPARNAAHRESIMAIREQGTRKRAAQKLRRKIQAPKSIPVKREAQIAGGQGNKNFDQSKWD